MGVVASLEAAGDEVGRSVPMPLPPPKTSRPPLPIVNKPLPGKAAALVVVNVPPLTVVPPVQVSLPETINAPAPAFVECAAAAEASGQRDIKAVGVHRAAGGGDRDGHGRGECSAGFERAAGKRDAGRAGPLNEAGKNERPAALHVDDGPGTKRETVGYRQAGARRDDDRSAVGDRQRACRLI